MKSLIKGLQSNPRILLVYDKIIKDQLKSGIIEIIKHESPSETSQDDCCKPRLHYLPHHGVVRQDSQTTKLRIVYNGSARALGDQYSLNDCLQTGPNHIPKLFNILIRFRWHKIAITADIEKAILMIGIDQADRDFLRFLWVKDPFKSPYELIHLRFTRLVFGIRPSPAILGSVLWHHIDKFESEWPELTKKLKDSFYVDDLLTGDAPLSGKLLDNWRSIISELGYLDGVKVSRCYLKFDSPFLATQLHGFSDASEQAFAAVVYMRSLYEDGSIKVSLVASKTRVAPTKKQTIPRLELLGAVILSRLMNNVIASLPGPMSTFYWTDSMATLHWIRVVKPWKQYVSH